MQLQLSRHLLKTFLAAATCPPLFQRGGKHINAKTDLSTVAKAKVEARQSACPPKQPAVKEGKTDQSFRIS